MIVSCSGCVQPVPRTAWWRMCGCSIRESVLPGLMCLSKELWYRSETWSTADSSVTAWVLDPGAGRKTNKMLWVIRREIGNKLEKHFCVTISVLLQHLEYLMCFGAFLAERVG